MGFGKKTAVKKSSSAEDLPGAFPPLGFWDPAGFSTDCSEGRLAYYREAELKHGRVCMLASLGLFTAERYHPLFGGAIDVNGWETLICRTDVLLACALGFEWRGRAHPRILKV